MFPQGFITKRLVPVQNGDLLLEETAAYREQDSSMNNSSASLSVLLLRLQTCRCDRCVTQRIGFGDGSVTFFCVRSTVIILVFRSYNCHHSMHCTRGGGGVIYGGVIPPRRTLEDTLFVPRPCVSINRQPFLIARIHLGARLPLCRRMTDVERPSRAIGMTPEMLSKLVSNPEVMVLMQNSKLQEVMKKVRHISTNLSSHT